MKATTDERPTAPAVGLGKASVTGGSRLLVAGAGLVGLLVTQVARAPGATDVVVSDVATDRLDTARRLGATHTVVAGAVGSVSAVDAFIDCSGAESAVRSGMAAVRPAGRVVLVGMGAAELALPLGLIQERELTVTGTFELFREQFSLLRRLHAQVQVSRLATRHYI